MASTITGTSTNWTISSPAGQLAGAGKNAANASLTDDGTVVIKSADGVLWAGDIMSLGGLAGATPALRFTDLLNNFLTSLSAASFLGSARYTMVTATVSTTTGDPIKSIPYDTVNIQSGAVCTTLTSPGVVTVNTAGVYLVSATVSVNRTAGTDTSLGLILLLNAAARARCTMVGSTATFTTGLVATIMNCAVGDTIACQITPPIAIGTTYAVNPNNSQGNTSISAVCLNPASGGGGSVSTTVVNNATDTGEALVTGSAPNYTVKRFKAGNNVTLSSNATSVTINAAISANGFSVSYGTVTTFTAAFVSIPFNDYFRNAGTLTWLGPTTSSLANGAVALFNVGVTISTASTGIITFQLTDGAQVYLSRSVAAGYTGPLSFSGIVTKIGGAGALVLQAKSTVADGQFDFSYGAVGQRNNWFDGTLLS